MPELRFSLPAKFESVEIANARRLKLVTSLSHDPELARRPEVEALLACTPETPCGREGCPVCMRTFREQLLMEAYRLGLHDAVWTRASIVPAGWRVQPGKLENFWLKKAVRLLRKWLERSEIRDAVVIGGIDVSFNTFGNQALGWQFHVYFLINRPKSEALRQAIKSAFRLDPNVRFPLTLKEVRATEFAKTLSYSYKSTFKRSSGYIEKRRMKADGSPRKNSHPLPLPLGKLRELSSALAQYPIGSRLILRNAIRTTSPGGELRMSLRVQPQAVSSRSKRKRRPRRAGSARRRVGKQA